MNWWDMNWYSQRIDFEFVSGTDPQRCNQLEQFLLTLGFAIRHSSTNQHQDSLEEARIILSKTLGNDLTAEIILYAMSGRTRLIITEGWELIMTSNDQRELLRFSTRFVLNLTSALNQYGPKPTEIDSKSPIKKGLIASTLVSGIFSALSWAFVGYLGVTNSIFLTILVVVPTTLYSAVRQS